MSPASKDQRQTGSSPIVLAGRTASPFVYRGIIIPIVLAIIVRSKLSLLSPQIAVALAKWLSLIWPMTLTNYSTIVNLDHQVDAEAYLTLIILMYAYMFYILQVVWRRLTRLKTQISSLRSKDHVIVFFCIGLTIFVMRVTVDIEFKKLGDLYIDSYGFWLFKMYAYYSICIVTASFLVAYVRVLLENLRNERAG
jgi:hypothetical protein